MVTTNRAYVALAALFVLIAVGRVLASYKHTAQGFDEPCHVAAGIEFLDRHTYTLDPIHPTLARVAVALPLYLAGERLPKLEPPASLNYNAVGDAILNDSGHYLRNLVLARLGMLPFLLLGCGVVFLWARREYGGLAAVMAVALFTTIPSVLAFSSVAYTDMAAASTQVLAFWALGAWLEKNNSRSAAGLGLAAGLTLLAKTTALIFLPACGVSVALVKWWLTRDKEKNPHSLPWSYAKQLAMAGAIAVMVVWAGYGFSVGRVDESMNLSPASMPEFRSFPAPVANIGRHLILSDPEVPVPALIKGLATIWAINGSQPQTYLLGHIKRGGWWYFFLVAVAVKSPIPFLILLAVGLLALRDSVTEGRWSAIVPVVCAATVLLVTMPAKINYGVRHVLVVFPLFAMVAGCGCSYLWHRRDGQRAFFRAALVALLLWQCISTVRASGDFLAYFNELAGKDPSKVLVAGCDLDCGQDLFGLVDELKRRHVSHVTLALWTSADVGKMGLPAFDVAQPYQPATGWFAISLRALRFGDLFHSTYPPGAFAWLDRYQPVARVGKTILLYHIPE
jgi:hypothetical protein